MGGFAQFFGFSLESILTPGIRTALPFIISGTSGGLSANEIQRALTAAQMGVRRVDLLNVVRVLRTEGGYPPYLRGTVAVNYPPPSEFRFALWPTKNPYTYTFKVTGTHAVTGQPWESYVSVGSGSLITEEEALQEARALIDEAVIEVDYGLFDLGAPLDFERLPVLVSPYPKAAA